MPLITIRGLSFRYHRGHQGDPGGLCGIDLDIYDGEWLAVVGPNGSGKSTLARHLNGLLLPEEGEVLVAGMSTSLAANGFAIRQTVGMVFQNPDNQMVAPLVHEEVAFGPENLGLPPQETRKRVEEALALVGMSHHAQSDTSELSGGEKQRVALAAVLAMKPRCLVLDEVTSLLDGEGRRDILRLIHQLNREHKVTIVMITHSMEEAVMADRIVVMNKGRLGFVGTPRELFRAVGSLPEGLTPPWPVRLCSLLGGVRGFSPGTPVTTEELVEFLCALRTQIRGS